MEAVVFGFGFGPFATGYNYVCVDQRVHLTLTWERNGSDWFYPSFIACQNLHHCDGTCRAEGLPAGASHLSELPPKAELLVREFLDSNGEKCGEYLSETWHSLVRRRNRGPFYSGW